MLTLLRVRFRNHLCLYGLLRLLRLASDLISTIVPLYRDEQLLLNRLDRSNTDYEHLLLNANAPIVVLSKDLRIMQWNKFIQRITGYPSEMVEGSSILGFLHESDRFIGKETFEACLCGAKGAKENSVFQFVCKNGSLRKLEVSLTSLRDEVGNVSMIIVLGLDVTNRSAAHLAAMQAQKAHAVAETAKTMCEFPFPAVAAQVVSDIFDSAPFRRVSST